ncbi:hypothetical protein [Thermofilum sp.]
MSTDYSRINRREEDDVFEELKYLDDLDIAIILTIGSEKLSHLKIQKIAFLASKMLGLESDAVGYAFGPFSETIMEKLTTGYLSDYIVKEGRNYTLKDRGLKVYKALSRKLAERGKENELKAIETLRKLPEEKILLLTYHLYPEHTKESKIIDIIERMKKEMKEKYSKLVRIERPQENVVVLEIDV